MRVKIFKEMSPTVSKIESAINAWFEEMNDEYKCGSRPALKVHKIVQSESNYSGEYHLTVSIFYD